VHHLRHRLEQPFGFSQWTYDTRNALLVEIITESGLVGWGECYGPAEVTLAAIESFYAPRLIGQDPLQTDRIWQEMWRASLDFARGGVMMGAISGIDMGLWDLKGKALRLPVSELIGGRYIDQIRCYATGMYFRDLPQGELIDLLVSEAQGYLDEGFHAFKIKIGKTVRFDKILIGRIRKSLPDVVIMADSNHAYSLPEAISIGRVLDEYDYAWFEEPLSPEFHNQFRFLQEKLDLPLASGECEQTRFGFQRLLSSGGIQIAQPDLAYCGGLSEAIKIRALASSMGINVVPHVWGTQLNLAAAVHFLATTYVEPGRAESELPLLEMDRTTNPLRDDLFGVSLQVENGVVEVPSFPGLGVIPDDSCLEHFRIRLVEVN
jgi:D-galactarolactone cycloisomerase